MNRELACHNRRELSRTLKVYAPMRFGVMVSSWGSIARDISLYARVARQAEELGFESFVVSDHFMAPGAPPAPPAAHSSVDAWTLLPYLAALTERIGLGTCVTPLPLRPPALLAKAVATFDQLSNGRAILGVGAGWLQSEFEAYTGVWDPPRIRVAKTGEALDLILKLWTSDLVNFEGQFYKAKNAVLEPKPLQKPHPPLWFGAMNKGTIGLAGRFGDAWFPSVSLGAALGFYREGIKELLSTANAAGRGDKVTVGLMGSLAEQNLEYSLPIMGLIDQAAEKLEDYRREGCQYFIGVFLPAERGPDLMKRFAQEVMPSFA